MSNNNLQLLVIVILLICTPACVTHNELLNFNEGNPFPVGAEDIPELPVLQIQPDDLLSIRVRAESIEAAAPYNIDPAGGNNNLGSQTVRPLLGYLVDREGYIDFPILGRLKVGGLTTQKAKDLINQALESHLENPVVIVRFLNFRLTILGEVSSPGTYLVGNERISILDLLGLAGDITPYGNRTNITIVREKNGQRTYGEINLHDRDVFQSPYFFLQQNDFVYVEPLQERTAALRDQSQRVFSYISGGITLISFIITLANLR